MTTDNLNSDKYPFYDWISDRYNYKNMSIGNPLKPLVLWANTNSMLDKYYKQPNINLNDDNKDNAIRNDMRHITGLALAKQEYPEPIAYTLGYIKEAGDGLKELLFKKPYLNMSQKYFDDLNTDLKNNELGINYTTLYPDATPQEIMDFAYNKSINKNNLYNLLRK